jgi:hypothetical protein
MDIVDPVSTREHAGPIATARAAFKTHGRGFIVRGAPNTRCVGLAALAAKLDIVRPCKRSATPCQTQLFPKPPRISYLGLFIFLPLAWWLS